MVAFFCLAVASAGAADDVVLRLTFERADEPAVADAMAGKPSYRLQHGAEVRIDPTVAIGGEGALWCDTTGSDGEWHEFLHIDGEAVPLEANATYQIAWDYRLVSLADDANLYFLARSAAKPIAHDRGWISWRAAPGTYGHREVTFTLGPYDDYYLIFGIRRRGAVVIDNVVVRRVPGKPAKPAARLVMMTSMTPPGGIVRPGEAVSVRCEAMRYPEAIAFGTLAPYKEEHQANGDVWATLLRQGLHRAGGPALPGEEVNADGVKLTFALKRDDVTDWIDWNGDWTPPLDLSAVDEAVIEVMSDRVADGLRIKIMAGQEVVAEQRIAPDAADRWQTFRVPLRGERERVTRIGFYLPCRGSIAAGERITCYLRNLRFEPEPAFAKASAGKPAWVRGRVVDLSGREVPAQVELSRGRDSSRQEAPLGMTSPAAAITARGLPPGYYEAQFEAGAGDDVDHAKASFAVIPDPPPVSADDPFGINHGQQYIEHAGRAGIAWDRINLGWRRVEVEPDRWREEIFEPAVARSQRAGVNLLGLLAGPPQWRQDIVPGVGPRVHDVYWRTFVPKAPAAFGEFVSRMVRRYGDRIRYWEIWNEPQITEIFFYGGTPERYLALLKEAYRRAKEGDPDCVVVGMGGVGPHYLEKCLALGAAEFMDAVSIHSYQPGVAPEGGHLVSDLVRTRALLEEYGKPMPIWLTETGWPTIEGKSRGWRGSSEADQARYLVRSFLLSMAHGVEKFFFYMLFDSGTDPTEFEHNQGLLRHDLTPKPSYVAYANLIRATAGLRFARRLEVHPAVYAFVFEGDDRATLALWSLADKLTMTLRNPADDLRASDMMGAPLELGAPDLGMPIAVGESPIYIDVARDDLAALEAALRGALWSEGGCGAALSATASSVGENAAIVQVVLRMPLSKPTEVTISIEETESIKALPREGVAVRMTPGEVTEVGFLVRWVKGARPEAIDLRFDGKEMGGGGRLGLSWL